VSTSLATRGPVSRTAPKIGDNEIGIEALKMTAFQVAD
jgi:hypothetical protein